MANADHKNFHGSRDVYSVFKTMKVKLESKNCDEDDLVDLLTMSIERNFSGALYKQKRENNFIEISEEGRLKSTTKLALNGIENYNREQDFITLSMMNNLYDFKNV